MANSRLFPIGVRILLSFDSDLLNLKIAVKSGGYQPRSYRGSPVQRSSMPACHATHAQETPVTRVRNPCDESPGLGAYVSAQADSARAGRHACPTFLRFCAEDRRSWNSWRARS